MVLDLSHLPIIKSKASTWNKNGGDNKDRWKLHSFRKKKTGCTIMSGGWIDKRRRTILNFLVIRTKCIVLLESIQASYLSNEWEIFEIIVEVAEANVVQTVTDNAGNFSCWSDLNG